MLLLNVLCYSTCFVSIPSSAFLMSVPSTQWFVCVVLTGAWKVTAQLPW